MGKGEKSCRMWSQLFLCEGLGGGGVLLSEHRRKMAQVMSLPSSIFQSLLCF